MWLGNSQNRVHRHLRLLMLRLQHNTEHLVDAFLLVDVILLEQLLVQPVGVCNARNRIRNLAQPHNYLLANTAIVKCERLQKFWPLTNIKTTI